jgi:hypothetical protein
MDAFTADGTLAFLVAASHRGWTDDALADESVRTVAVTLSFQNGKLAAVKVERSLKPTDL